MFGADSLTLQLLYFYKLDLKHGSAAPSYVCQPALRSVSTLNVQLCATLTAALHCKYIVKLLIWV